MYNNNIYYKYYIVNKTIYIICILLHFLLHIDAYLLCDSYIKYLVLHSKATRYIIAYWCTVLTSIMHCCKYIFCLFLLNGLKLHATF